MKKQLVFIFAALAFLTASAEAKTDPSAKSGVRHVVDMNPKEDPAMNHAAKVRDQVMTGESCPLTIRASGGNMTDEPAPQKTAEAARTRNAPVRQ